MGSQESMRFLIADFGSIGRRHRCNLKALGGLILFLVNGFTGKVSNAYS